MKKLLCLVLTALLLCSCTALPKEQTVYEATFLELFDTVTVIRGSAESKETFTQLSQNIRDQLERYHRLFDIYHDYPGLNNLKTVNDNAGIAPVQVEAPILALLKDCKAYWEATDGFVNVAMGSVLRLWHDARTAGINDPSSAQLPDGEELAAAAEHTDLSQVILDEKNSTVYLADPKMRLDVGAVAKGWAAQRVAEAAPKGLLISVGGNICATGPKTQSGAPWVVGVQDPRDPNVFVHTLYVTDGSVVTSGDYQRTYLVDGQLYHHIIDPNTQMPGTLWRSVTLVCPDSGAADMLSTALFLLPKEQGEALLALYDAYALWIDAQGNLYYSQGFEKFIRT
jgi:thiamine biosynthesis lipoprotein